MVPTLNLMGRELQFKCHYDDRLLVKSISGYRWSKELKSWLYPFNKYTIIQIRKFFPDVVISPEVLEEVKKEESENARALRFKDEVIDIDIPLKSTLCIHQKRGVGFLLSRNSSMLADEMGVGKSLQSLAAVIYRKQKGEVNKCLIVCPSTIKNVWVDEIDKHTHEKCMMVDGTKKKRDEIYREYLENDVTFLIVNYECLLQDRGYFGVNKKFQYIGSGMKVQAIIADESIRIKNYKAKSTKTLKAIPATYRIAVSGFPIANRVEDIWSQIDWVKPNYLGNRWQFEDLYIVHQQFFMGSRDFKKIVGYRNLEQLSKKLEPLYIRRLKKEVLQDLPDKIYQNRYIILTDKEQMHYDEMKENMRLFIEKQSEEDISLKANSILVQLLRLSQITTGFVTDQSFSNPVWFTDSKEQIISSKIKEIDIILEELVSSGQKVVIWSRFVPVVKQLYKRYKELYGASYISGEVSVKDRGEIVRRFQEEGAAEGGGMVFIGQVQSGGMGITLHRACYEIFIDKAFISPSSIIQAEDRLHRRGQKNAVNIISLIVKGTVDEHWEKLMITKRDIAEKIMGDKPFQEITKQDLLEMLQ